MSEVQLPAYKASVSYAIEMDQSDPLRSYRDKFHLPIQKNGQSWIYFCGNSLGLQPKSTQQYIDQELEDWKKLAVEGHFQAKNPWLPYHEFLTRAMADIVGGKALEVVVMNTLSVNLHLMMVSFYRPSNKRFKILIEADAFPSDRYAVESQIRFHGYDPTEALILLKGKDGNPYISTENIENVLDSQGDQIALILIGNTNYYTGQFFDMPEIVRLGHHYGCKVGFDCAHGAGNVPLNLHESGADFAVWCTYKYLNSGPGSLGGCFVHERHATDHTLPRFAGWWGQNKLKRFTMRDDFEAIEGVEGWQLSNPPILSMAAIRSSLDIFQEVGMEKIRNKSMKLSGFLEFLIEDLEDRRIKIITPRDPMQRGCQLSISVRDADKRLFEKIMKSGAIPDWREPNVIRVSPAPLYNSFEDVYRFVQILKEALR